MNDLIKHFIAGAVIASITCVVVLLILGTDKQATDWAIGLAFGSAFLAGLTKELYDKYIKHTFFDVADLTVTWFGSIVPIIVWGVMQNYV